MRKLPGVERVSSLRRGADHAFDAWYYTFRAENNIEHSINPSGVASDEQLAFMVHTPPDGVYVPCSDSVFAQVTESYNCRSFTPELLHQYAVNWRMVVRLVRQLFADQASRRDMLNYCRHRFRGSLALRCLLPSRLIKRLVTTIISQSSMDPWLHEREAQNALAAELLSAPDFRDAMDRLPAELPQGGLDCLRRKLEFAHLARLLYVASFTPNDFSETFDSDSLSRIPKEADAFVPLLNELWQRQEQGRGFSRVVLYLCSSSGGLVQDLAVVEALLRMGHKVVLALKDDPFFFAPLLDDLERDPVLMRHLPHSKVLRDKAVTKNDLLRQLRERRLVIISDGTAESLNLYRASVTFARAWKECDMVLAKGERTAQTLLNSSSSFTRDICCFWTEKDEQDGQRTVHMRLKKRPDELRKFSEEDLNDKAGSIIRQMRAARDQGKAVMFYSCIIGSIPGETRTAIQVASAFVEHLRVGVSTPDEGVFVINPAEHFEPGMDGDDLMFMWETVQRSGLINIWRFQSSNDVEQSFRLLKQPMPPLWYGKDATFSTGCTKEMRIALDMQRQHPELQLIGPEPEKFFRRADYGVGKFFDATLRYRSEQNL